jgi:PIN domain nuclease of toxin-antitoxin system
VSRRYLLDTHVLLLLLYDDTRVPTEVVEALSRPLAKVYVSSISIVEIEIKRSIGKLLLDSSPLDFIDQMGFKSLDLTTKEARRLSELPLIHRDPFDRLLICQALENRLTLVTADEFVSRYPVNTISI